MWGQITVYKICISKSWPNSIVDIWWNSFCRILHSEHHTHIALENVGPGMSIILLRQNIVSMTRKISDDEIFLCTLLHNFVQRYWQYHSLHKMPSCSGWIWLLIFLKKCQKSSHFLASCQSRGLSEIPLKFNKIPQEDLCNILTCYYFHFESNI